MWEDFSGHRAFDRFTDAEAAFIQARDSFYVATVSETGWPYVQHRGGPVGFLKVLDETTLGFADFRGNRQYISLGNAASDDRVASQAQAKAPLSDVRGLVFFAFPLHAVGKPSDARAAHLAEVKIPMLFVQGTRDRLADMQRLRPVLVALGSRATPLLLEEADHSFHVPALDGTA